MIVKDGYIVAVEKGDSNYTDVINAIDNIPAAPDGYGYRLREDLTWELYEMPIVEETEDDEITNEEAYNIIMGVTQ